VETVGDVLRKIDPNSKVVAISGKDRGAILPGGHRGVAYMYMTQTGQFASTTYYMKEHPAWVTAFNDAKPADAYFGREWKPLLPDAAYAKSLPDNQKWYAKGGALPKKMGEGSDKPGPLYYGSLLPSPFGDDLTLNFARAAIVGENLGKDDSPDILSISLSGHDYVNHAYSAESRLSHDHTLQLDRLLQSFYQDLDRMVGKDNYVLILTADHGFMPAPEASLALGRNAGRMSGSQAIARINAALGKQFGEGTWVKYFSASAAELDKKLIAERKVDLAAITEAARKQLEAQDGIAVAYTRAEITSNSRAGAPFFDQMRKSWNAGRSGDIQYALKPYWMLTSSTNSTTHGSPHLYDTNIPIVFYGPAWIGAGRVDTRVEEADVAPTIARLLGIPPPVTAEGKPLPLTPPAR